MNVITLDLEMNKTEESNSIIQLGYTINNVKTGKNLCIKCIYINPKEVISPFITELTGITQEQADGGVALKEAYEEMVTDINRYQTSKFPLQWGLDHYELREQLGIEWSEYAFSRRCIDVKSLYQAYAMISPRGKSNVGLGRAVHILGLEFIGRAHNALTDSIATFDVFYTLAKKMHNYDSIKAVTTNRKDV